MKITLTLESLAKDMAYTDFLKLAHIFHNNLKEEYNYTTGRFFDDIKDTLKREDAKQIINKKSFMDNLIIAYSDMKFSLIADKENIFDKEDLEILRTALIVNRDNYELTPDGVELMKENETIHNNSPMYDYDYIRDYILERYCERV